MSALNRSQSDITAYDGTPVRLVYDHEADMLEIWSNIADDKPSAADRFLDSLEQRIELLSRHPKIGESRPDLGRRVRAFTIGNYVILFRPIRDGIEVVRVLHGSRDIPAIFRRKSM